MLNPHKRHFSHHLHTSSRARSLLRVFCLWLSLPPCPALFCFLAIVCSRSLSPSLDSPNALPPSLSLSISVSVSMSWFIGQLLKHATLQFDIYSRSQPTSNWPWSSCMHWNSEILDFLSKRPVICSAKRSRTAKRCVFSRSTPSFQSDSISVARCRDPATWPEKFSRTSSYFRLLKHLKKRALSFNSHLETVDFQGPQRKGLHTLQHTLQHILQHTLQYILKRTCKHSTHKNNCHGVCWGLTLAAHNTHFNRPCYTRCNTHQHAYCNALANSCLPIAECVLYM